MQSLVLSSDLEAKPVEPPSRKGLILFVAFFVALAIGLASLNWRTSLEAYVYESDYSFKDNTLVQRRVALNTYLIIGYGIYAILGAIALTQWKSLDVSVLRWWIVFPGVFWLWCGMSVLWSVEPSLSVRRVGHLYMAVAGGFGIAILLRPKESIWAIIWSMTALLMIGLIAEVTLGTFNPWRPGYRHGGLGHPNETGLFAAVLVLAARVAMLVEVVKGEERSHFSWRVCFCLVLFGLYIILIAKSRTTLASLMVSLMVIELLVSKPSRAIFVFGAGTAGVAFLGLLLGMVRTSTFNAFFGIATIGRSSHVGTLTGRVPLWEAILTHVDRRPMLGHGYGGYWTTKRVEEFAQIFYWEPPNGHSIYIDCLVELGWVGLVMMILLLLVVLMSTIRNYLRISNRFILLSVSLVTMAIVHGLTESSFFKGAVGPMLLSFAIFSYAAIQVEAAHKTLEPEPPFDI